MKQKHLLFWLSFICLLGSSCKSDCDTAGKSKYPFPADSLLVSYTGTDTLRFQLADSMGNAFDTLIFFGVERRKHWSYGKSVFCGSSPILEESETEAFKFVNSADKDYFFYVVLKAMPEEDDEDHVWVSYGEYYPSDFNPNNSKEAVKRYRIHTSIKNGSFYGLKDTIEIFGKTYNNVVVSKATQKRYPFIKYPEQKAFFLNTHGILRIIENKDTVWNLVQ